VLGAEPTYPKDATEEKGPPGHEGEVTAARRLIEKMIALYGNRFFDILTTDAYYATKPFVLFVDSLGKYKSSEVGRYHAVSGDRSSVFIGETHTYR